MEVKFTLMMDVHVVPTAPVIKYFGEILIAIEANAINHTTPSCVPVTI